MTASGWTASRLQGIVFLGLMIILTLVSANLNLREPNLWFDESGQFWMAKGLDHFSPPLQKNGTLADVIRENRTYNLDPGGFTVLLRYWSVISAAHFWLRALPFSFLLLSSLALYLAGRKLFPGIREIAYLFALVPFVSRLIYSYAFEVRAYSMEVAGASMALLALSMFREKTTWRRSLFFGLCFAFFSTSRYATMVVLGIAALFICTLYLRKIPGGRSRAINFALFCAPFAIAFVLVYLVSLRYQLMALKQFGAPSYVWMFLSGTRKAKVLYSLPPAALLVLSGYLALRKDSIAGKYLVVALLACLSNAFFFAALILHRHPWDPTSKWNISLNLLSYVSIGMLGALGVEKFLSTKERLLYARGLLMSLFFAGSVFLTYWIWSSNLPGLGNLHYASVWSQTYNDIKDLDFGKYHKIYVNRSGGSSLRYLCEYGALRGKVAGYPDKFAIADRDPTSFAQIDHVEDYDLIITDDMTPLKQNEATAYGWQKIREDGTVLARVAP